MGSTGMAIPTVGVALGGAVAWRLGSGIAASTSDLLSSVEAAVRGDLSQAATNLSQVAEGMSTGVQRMTQQSSLVAGTSTPLTVNISAVSDSVQEASHNVGTVEHYNL
jgi:hypothetical protein